MKKLFVVASIIIVLAAGGLIFALRSNPTGRVTFAAEQLAQLDGVLVGNTFYSSTDSANGLELPMGGHAVKPVGNFAKNESVSVELKANETVLVDFSTSLLKTGEELIGYVGNQDLEPGFAVYTGELFEDNTWMVVTIYSPDASQEGFVNIYQYVGGRWTIIESGTGFDPESYENLSLPQSVRNYLLTPLEEQG